MFILLGIENVAASKNCSNWSPDLYNDSTIIFVLEFQNPFFLIFFLVFCVCWTCSNYMNSDSYHKYLIYQLWLNFLVIAYCFWSPLIFWRDYFPGQKILSHIINLEVTLLLIVLKSSAVKMHFSFNLEVSFDFITNNRDSSFWQFLTLKKNIAVFILHFYIQVNMLEHLGK